MLTFAIEPLAGIWEEKVACAQAHWAETTMCANGEVMDLRYERYAQYEAAGWYMEFVARDETHKVAGFCGMYLLPSMHTQKLLATEDVLYLKPGYRVGRNGVNFYRAVELEMGRRGAAKLMLTAPPGSSSSRILSRLGYEVSATQYSKLLTNSCGAR